MQKVLLIGMPSAGIYRPLLGISLLKAELKQCGIPVDIRYLNLLWAKHCFESIDGIVSSYKELQKRASRRILELLFQQSQNHTMADEWIFARALYEPDYHSDHEYIDKLLSREYDDAEVQIILSFRQMASRFLDECIGTISWQQYTVVGFTSTFTQQISSLALAKRIKHRYPELKIVFGGANCEGSMGKAVLRHFPFVDFVVSGEADESFLRLLSCFDEALPYTDVPGIVWRNGGEPMLHSQPAFVTNMDALPSPDYDDFFEQYRDQPYAHLVDVRIPLEQSRGCWWGMRSHCTFCGLNGQTMSFRAKSPDRAKQDLLEARARYGAEFVDFTDNILHLEYFKTLLPELADLDHGIELFYEIKSNIKKPQLELLRRAGVMRVQPGIESFSSGILRLMGKGCTGLQNIQCLKWCLQYGIYPEWNLLYGFPNENPDDYDQILATLQSITHLRPPRSVSRIRMDRFSPNFDQAAAKGFVNVRPQLPYFHLHPLNSGALHELAYFFDCDYADGRDPESYIGPIKDFVDLWTAQERSGALAHISLERGGALIDDSRFNSVRPHFQLSDVENRIYIFCDEGRSFDQIARLNTPTDTSIVRSILSGFVSNRLMVQDGDKFLSLAPTSTFGKEPEAFDIASNVLAILA